MKKTKYHITAKGNYIKVYINDIPHIVIPHLTTLIIKTWIDNDTWFNIQIIVDSTPVTFEYDDFDRWKTIVNLLNSVIK